MTDGPARLTAGELLGVAAPAVALALAMHWPLPLHLGPDIAQDLGDPLVQAWQIAWDGHAPRTQPGGEQAAARDGVGARASRCRTLARLENAKRNADRLLPVR